MEEEDNAYEILGVQEDAPRETIHRAYIKLCRKWHPDKGVTEDDIRRRTMKMFRFNAAKTILLDAHKRESHDADLRDRRNGTYVPRNRGNGYDENGFVPTRKPRPEGLAKTYIGDRRTPETFFCCSDGAHGEDGISGRRGWEGSGAGGHGTPGTNAGPSSPGLHAGDMRIHLRVNVAEDGSLEVDVQHIRNEYEIIDPTQQNLRSVPLKSFGTLEWSAKGGKGGNGGMGGHGGNGATGYPGRDATRYSSGTNGGPGGNGGDGGKGTHGSDGGRGGDVIIFLDRDDAYLLMRVEGCHPKYGSCGRFGGGRGGDAGRHGRGGMGGAGGRGGSSYSWTTTSTVTRYSNGRSYSDTVTHYHSNPGGCSGPSGWSGRTLSSPLHRGSDGASGSLVLRIKYPNEKEFDYKARFDLQFVSVETENVSDMIAPKTFEFGETVFVPRVQVVNTGLMETPKQRVMIRFGQAHGVVCDTSGVIFLSEEAYVTPGNKDFAEEGFLQFSCPYPVLAKDESTGTNRRLALVTDFDPLHSEVQILYRAYQLGHENQTDDLAQISDFQARYADFHPTPDIMQLAYPVENNDGVQGFRSLAPLETSILEFTLHNTSHQEFGDFSTTKRSLFINIYYADDRDYEIPIESIVVRGRDAMIIDIPAVFTASCGKGYRFDVRSLPAAGDYTVQLSFKFDSSTIQVAEKAGLQLDCYLQKVPVLLESGEKDSSTRKKLIQRRLFVASCQPRFNPDISCELVLVTTTATGAQQYQAWKNMLEEMGFTAQAYSLSRYGHMSPSSLVEDLQVLEAFRDKLVIVLNDKYVPKANDRTERLKNMCPSEMVGSVYEYSDTTQFLFVGGSVGSVQHLNPTSSALETLATKSISHANRKSCRKTLLEHLNDQRLSGLSCMREKPNQFDVTVKTKSFFPPSKDKILRVVEKRAKQLTKWLQKNDPLRSYTVTWCALEEGGVQSQEGRFQPWQVGSLRVTSGPSRSHNPFAFVEEERGTAPGRVSRKEVIRSRAMIFATVQALSFSAKMKCYSRHLRSSALNPGEVSTAEAVLEVVKDCLVGEFVMDVTNYDHGRLAVKKLENRSPLLQQLRFSESLNAVIDDAQTDKDLSVVATRHLSALMAAFRCVVRSKDLRPWWKPFSHKHLVGRHMIKSLDHFADHWSPVLDQGEIMIQQIALEDKVRDSIKERKKSRFALVSSRGRYRASVITLHSPKNSQSYQHSFRTVRVRRESDVMGGDTMKIKKMSSRTLSSLEHNRELQVFASQQSYRKSVQTTTETEYGLYVRQEVPTDQTDHPRDDWLRQDSVTEAAEAY